MSRSWAPARSWLPFEAFNLSPVAEGLAGLPNTNRSDYGFGDVRGFATVDVNGSAFTVSFHVQDEPVPRFSRTFFSTSGLSRPMLQTNQQFEFILHGETGHRYCIETSSNLVLWSALRTNTVDLPDGEWISESMSTDSSQQFYRSTPTP